MKTSASVLTIIMYLFLATSVIAGEYTPDIIEFDGTNNLSFPPDSALTLNGGGTIEFWVAPDWQKTPDYEPVILSNTGELGPSYLVTMLQDKLGVAVYAGDNRLEAPFDFTDGQMHFVAIVDLGDELNVLIDNLLVATGRMTFVDLPSSGFWIGTSDGENFPFVGAVAGMRIWDTPLDPYTLIEFAMQDIETPSADHPDLDFLIGVSRFRTQSFYLQPIAE